MNTHISFHDVNIDDINGNEVYTHNGDACISLGEDGFKLWFASAIDLQEFGEHLVAAAHAVRHAPKDSQAHFCWIDREIHDVVDSRV